MAIFAGALQPKSKAELQELAIELSLSDSGTKNDVHDRIKTHLAGHPELSTDPRFAGLYLRKKKPTSVAPTDGSHHLEANSDAMARRSRPRTLPPVHDQPSPEPSVLNQAMEKIVDEPPRPPSPVKAMLAQLNKAIAATPARQDIVKAAKERGIALKKETDPFRLKLKAVLSNAKNIASITVFAELLWLIYTIVPWATYEIPLNPPYTTKYGHGEYVAIAGERPPFSTITAKVPYPPLDFVRDPSNYLGHIFFWAIPTFLLPLLVGTLISFRPAEKDRKKADDTDALTEADPLTSSIIRVAAVFASNWGVNWERLGFTFQWRVLSASVACAFALAEAVGERKKIPTIRLTTHKDHKAAIEETPGRRRITAE